MRRSEARAWCLALVAPALTACAHAASAPVAPSVVAPALPPPADSGAASVARDAKACDAGSAKSCNLLGVAYLEGGSGATVDKPRAARFFERACDLDLPAGCLNLGFVFRDGVGVPRDLDRAIGPLTRACDASLWDGCFMLADIYLVHEREDVPLGFKLFERACSGGHPRSCASEALLLSVGKGAPKNTVKAAALAEKACDDGVHFACSVLGNVLLEGDGVAGDPERVRSAYEKGCADDNANGCYLLGVVCAAHKAGDECAARADEILQHACDLGQNDACTLLDRRKERRRATP